MPSDLVIFVQALSYGGDNYCFFNLSHVPRWRLHMAMSTNIVQTQSTVDIIRKPLQKTAIMLYLILEQEVSKKRLHKNVNHI